MLSLRSDSPEMPAGAMSLSGPGRMCVPVAARASDGAKAAAAAPCPRRIRRETCDMLPLLSLGRSDERREPTPIRPETKWPRDAPGRLRARMLPISQTEPHRETDQSADRAARRRRDDARAEGASQAVRRAGAQHLPHPGARAQGLRAL